MVNIRYQLAGLDELEILVKYRMVFALELAGQQTAEAIEELNKQYRNYFAKALEEKNCIACVAWQDLEVAGIGSLIIRQQPGNFKNPSGRVGYFMNMYTPPEYRRQGICTAILNILLEEAKRIGVRAFELHATKEGEKVYLKNGFIIHNEPTYRKYF